MRKNSQLKNVFCLEGIWGETLKYQSTIEPALQLLEKHQGIRYIHRNCATTEELQYYLNKWSLKMYADYPILYLAFHGDDNVLKLQGKVISLEELAIFLENKCRGRVVIFGSCSTLNINKRYIKKFLKLTGALAVCGYKTDIDWIKSTLHDLLIIEAFQNNEFSLRGIDSIQAKTATIASKFKELKFILLTQKEVMT